MQEYHYDLLLKYDVESERKVVAEDFSELLINDLIDFNTISKISEATIQLINDFVLLSCIKAKIITFEKLAECNESNAIEVIAEIYAQRLYGVARNLPFTIGREPDTMDNLLEELSITAEGAILFGGYFETSETLKMLIANSLISFIERELNDMLKMYKGPKFNKIIQRFTEIIHKRQSADDGQSCLDALIDMTMTDEFNEQINNLPQVESSVGHSTFDKGITIFSIAQSGSPSTTRLSDRVKILQDFSRNLQTLSSFTTSNLYGVRISLF
jgi:hypothetical protein